MCSYGQSTKTVPPDSHLNCSSSRASLLSSTGPLFDRAAGKAMNRKDGNKSAASGDGGSSASEDWPEPAREFERLRKEVIELLNQSQIASTQGGNQAANQTALHFTVQAMIRGNRMEQIMQSILQEAEHAHAREQVGQGGEQPSDDKASKDDGKQ